ncbi:MAG: DUF115 domain-containing protein [Treponema sp.]|nr:DUF115 domain-containing protein [Treponema sp.]
MDKQTFERNLLALSKNDPHLCVQLSSAITTAGIYRFLHARSGEIIPAITDSNGAAHPLHSTVDPRREAQRLISTLTEEGCLLFLGLGGAFAAEAALEREASKKILIIEYDINGIAELLSSKDYIKLFRDNRVRLLCNPSAEQLEAFILGNYIPAIDGGIRVIPLRVRTGTDSRFDTAADTVKNTIDTVSRDYSVQAYFGKRWFSNIIRNLPFAEKQNGIIKPIKKALICAAGPSLEEQVSVLKKEITSNNNNKSFIIASDTSLPVLLHADIEPDAVISIDCQHISYQHFFRMIPKKTYLFLDLASPPPVASRTENRIFFSGGHPLSLYISRSWRPLPVLDTSGANVTYAALSLAENLGAREITFYGADFSYPLGKTYARGTYIYPYFEKNQSRYLPLEAQHSVFLYRDSSLEKIKKENDFWHYETTSLKFYRKKVKEKEKAITENKSHELSLLCSGKLYQGTCGFLKNYRESVEKLEAFDILQQDEISATLLPIAAYFRRLNPSYNSPELFAAVKLYCLEELNKIIR